MIFDTIFTAIVIPVIATTCFYLGAWAKITEFAWSRYPKSLDSFMRCAACSGFWWSLLVTAFFVLVMKRNVFLLSPYGWNTLPALILGGLWGIYWVPLLARLHLSSLLYVGSLADTDDATPVESTNNQES